MADENLVVNITADASSVAPAVEASDQLSAALSNIEKYLQTMAAASTTATAATDKLAESHEAASVATKEHAEAESILGATLGKVEVGTNAAARAAAALGANTAEATERVEGFVEALDGLGKAAVPILAIGAAILAVSEAIGFVSEGIKEAADSQSLLASIGASVRAQGGDWDTARESVERFTTAVRNGTQYSEDEALRALNSLTSAGVSLADAEKIVAISTDVAAGSHRSLQEVVDRLKEAEAGRGLGLQELDSKLKPLIQSHADLSKILEQLDRDFAGEGAASLNTYAGRSQQLQNQIHYLGEEIGTLLLPALTQATVYIEALVEDAQAHEPQIASFFNAMITGAQWAANVIGGLADVVQNLGYVWTNATNAFHALDGEVATATSLEDTQRLAAGDTTDTLGAKGQQKTLDDGTPADAFHSYLNEARYLMSRRERSAQSLLASTGAQPLQHDMQIGNVPHAGGGATPVMPISDDSVEKTKAYEIMQKELDYQLKTLTESEQKYKNEVDLATNSTDAANAKLALAKKQSEDAGEAIVLLTQRINSEKNELEQQTAAHAHAEAAMDSAREKYNAYGASLGEGTKRTEASRAELERLKKAHDDARKTFEESGRAIAGLTADLDRNHEALTAAQANLEDYAKAQAGLVRAYNDGTVASQRKNAEELATFQQSLAAQRAYFERQISELDTHNADYLAKKLELEDKVRAIDLKIAEQPEVRAAWQASAQQQLADEDATYKKSLQQQIQYYAARYAATLGGNEAEEAENKKYYEEILKLEADEYKQRIDQHDAFMQQLKSTEESILDKIIEKHQSFREALKEIWTQIAQDIEKSAIASLLGGQTQKSDGSTSSGGIFGGLNSWIASIFGPQGGAAGAAGAPPALVNPLNAIQQNTAQMAAHLAQGAAGAGGGNASDVSSAVSAYGVTGLFAGSDGAQTLISQYDTSSVLATLLGTSAASQFTSESQIVAAATYATNGGGSIPAGAFTPGGGSVDAGGWASDAGQVDMGGIATGSWGALGGANKYLGAISSGLGVGQLVSGLDGGNSTYSDIGGVLGSLAGVVTAANPLAGLGLEVGGALLGSIFTGNQPTPGKNPDQFEGQTGYGQDIADITGVSSGANGTNYLPSAATLAFIQAMGVGNGGAGSTNSLSAYNTGGSTSSGGVDAAEIWLSQQNPNAPPPGYTQAAWAAQLAQWESVFGSSATGAGQLGGRPGDPNIGDLQITGAGSSPINTNYSTLAQDLAAIEAAASANGTNTPVFGLTRTYPSFTSTLGPQVGYTNPQTNQFTPTGGSSAPNANGGSVSYTINVNAAPMGTVPADVATAIAQAIQDIAHGIVPGSTTTTLNAKLPGN